MNRQSLRRAFNLLITLAAGLMAAHDPILVTASETALNLDRALRTPNWLTLSGSHRTRFETLDNQLRASLRGGDQLLAVKTALRADMNFGSTGMVVELWDARGYFGDGGGSVADTSVNTMEFVQAHLRYRAAGVVRDDDAFEITAGRLTMDVGSRRLVARQRFRNTTNAFTGLRAVWEQPQTRAFTVFYTFPQIRLPSDQPSVLDNEVRFDDEDGDYRFWGAHYQSQAIIPDVRTELYVYGLDEDDDRDRQTRNRELVTAGARLFRRPAPDSMDFDLEGGWQTGHARATSRADDSVRLDVDAHFLHAEAGYTFKSAWSPRWALAYDLASGDANPDDADYGRFDHLFGAIRRDLGPPGIWTLLPRSNLSMPSVRLDASPPGVGDFTLIWRWINLAEARDSFGGTGVVDRSGSSGTEVGRLLELIYRRWLLPDSIRLEFGVAAFFADDYLDKAPNANGNTDSAYGYAEISISF